MKRSMILAAVTVFLLSCGGNHAPDVSKIKVSAAIRRFDKAFFENTDTADLPKHVTMLQQQFPLFTNDFFEYILGLPLNGPADSSAHTYSEMKRFYHITKPLYDSLSVRFADLNSFQDELEKAFRYVKYYYPLYKVPEIVAYVGPFDAPAVAITRSDMAIGLQLFAGKDFSFYTSTEGQELYPMYISRRFEPEYIVPDCMKSVVEDMYPDNSGGRSLIEQIVEKGKSWYLLNKFLPGTSDSLKTGYTKPQLEWCDSNEGLIWNFILQNNDIYTTEPALIKTFIGDAPTTEGMPGSSPGNIGQWIGWRIVEKYAADNKEMTPDMIMKMDAKKLFTASKYKPK